MKGTIRERKKVDGTSSFLCQVPAGRDPVTGKRRFKTGVASSRREAHKLVHTLMADVEGEVGTLEAGTDRTVAELIDEWFTLAGPAAESTRAVYDGYIRRQVLPHLGHVKVRALRVVDLDRWYQLLIDDGLAPASIRKAHNIVRAALRQGVRWGWVPMNVAAHSSPPIVLKPIVATPTPETVKQLIAFIEPHDPDFALYVRLSGVLGARPGELCALQWRDVDFAKAELVLRRRVMRGQGRMVVEDLTKTGTIRRVPVDAGTLALLRSHRAASSQLAIEVGLRLEPDAFVFAAEPGGVMFWRPDRASRSFRTWLKRSGLPHVPLYSLRHQAATTMIDRGVDPKTVSERLGNSVATVLTTYTRARSTADIAASDLMGGIYDS